MRRRGRWAGLVWIVLGGGIAAEGARLGLGKMEQPGIGFMPCVVGIAMAVCGLLILAPPGRRSNAFESAILPEQAWTNLAAPLAGLFAFACVLQPLGFVAAAFLLQFFLLKVSGTRGWMRAGALAAAITAASWLVFVVWLKLPLPKGIWLAG